ALLELQARRRNSRDPGPDVVERVTGDAVAGRLPRRPDRGGRIGHDRRQVPGGEEAEPGGDGRDADGRDDGDEHDDQLPVMKVVMAADASSGRTRVIWPAPLLVAHEEKVLKRPSQRLMSPTGSAWTTRKGWPLKFA